MSTNRRRFLESAAANAAAFAVMPAAALAAMPSASAMTDSVSADEWNLTWTDKLKGKRTAVFDCTEPESGYGVWRAAVWKRQNAEVLKAAPGDFVPVIVLRHNAIILAMQQSFWDRYDIGKKKKVTDPMTEQPTTRNPVLSDANDDADLRKQTANGAVVLACNLAFQECASTIANHEKIGREEAMKRAIAALVPGVILQPSGVFAAIHAQNAGAMYIKAS